MIWAYDTFLQSEVSADLAAKDITKADSVEPYRYECAHCGEEVGLAAVGSNSVVPHFRHRSGNNNVECEDYSGQFNTDAHSRKSKSERADFYFNINTKMFYLGLRFSDNEISAYEQRSAIFELRTTDQASPFYSLKINNKNFFHDIPTMIPLERYSTNYFLSNTLNGVKREYKIFNRYNRPTFFKMQIGDSGYRAKLVRSSILYTNVPYLMVFQGQSQYVAPIDMPSEINVEKSFKFETMGRKFSGKVLTISAKTIQIASLVSSWGYQLEASETLTLLWPPATLSEDETLINRGTAYLYSTFELQAHGNINVRSEDITKISDRISLVAVHSRIKIYKKNAELMLKVSKQKSDDYVNIPVTRRVERIHQVLDDTSFLFNRSGALPLNRGMSIHLTPNSEIKHYKNGYLNATIIPPNQVTLDGETLLHDVLMHYKRTETFDWEDYDSLDLSQTAFKYIEDCEKAGLINAAAKLLIEKGRI